MSKNVECINSFYEYLCVVTWQHLMIMILMIMPGIVLCVSLLVVLPSPAEARATGGWLRFLKMLEEMKEDYPFPAEDYPEEFDAAILHPSTPPPEEEDYEDAAEPMEPWMRPPPLLPPAGEEEAPVRACYAWHGLTEHARKWIVWQHNVYRSTVAKGKESQGNPGPQPQASNMRVMVTFPGIYVVSPIFHCYFVKYWDSSLEAIAQGWADTCPQGHNPDVLPGGKYSNLGENYARMWTSGETNKDDWMGKKIATEFVAGR